MSFFQSLNRLVNGVTVDNIDSLRRRLYEPNARLCHAQENNMLPEAVQAVMAATAASANFARRNNHVMYLLSGGWITRRVAEYFKRALPSVEDPGPLDYLMAEELLDITLPMVYGITPKRRVAKKKVTKKKVTRRRTTKARPQTKANAAKRRVTKKVTKKVAKKKTARKTTR